ncbi:hypothetical protein [Pseudoalteromonas sp. T1lg23B]|uniref:hypothetical protein n=1 Tax=Pseudoalteromonas sp. T1lg23B TaxID=2077097 RepID=UPI000CF632AF|nr:hypothetical protein [Pseudoalteromonas sp. T1lg23B]
MENCKTLTADLRGALNAIQANDLTKSQQLITQVIAKVDLDLQIASSAKYRALSQLALMQDMEQELYKKEQSVLNTVEAIQSQLKKEHTQLKKKKVTVRELTSVLTSLRQKVESLEKDIAAQKKAFQRRQKKLNTLSKIPFIGAIFKASQGLDALRSMESITPYVNSIRAQEAVLNEKNGHIAATRTEIALLESQVTALNTEHALSKQRLNNLAILISQTRHKSSFFIDLELHLKQLQQQLQNVSYSAEDIIDLLEFVQSSDENIKDFESNELVNFSEALNKLQTLMNRSPKETFEFAKHSALKVLSNNTQNAYLMPTINGLTYYLQTQGKEDYSWNIPATGNHVIAVTQESKYQSSGSFSIGKYKNWLYSKHLFSKPEDLKYAIEVMLNPSAILSSESKLS